MDGKLLKRLINFGYFGIFLIFASVLFINIRKELWNDEIYSLVNFVFVPIKTTLADYHAANNHIFYNLINSLFLKIAGINSLDPLLENPFIIRILPLIFSIICCLFVYKAAKINFGQDVALLSLVLLFSTLAFSNHALQARGYSLSMMICSIIFYYHTAYPFKPDFRKLIILLIGTSLLIYTGLSNLWFVLAALCISVLQKQWKLSLAYFSGIILSIIFYIPVIPAILGNKILNSRDQYPLEIFWFYIPKIFYYFLSHRYLIVIFIGISIYTGFKKHRKQLILVLIFFLLPFIFSFLRMQTPPDRIYLFLLPFFAIFSAYAVQNVIELSGRFKLRFLLIFLIYLNFSNLFAIGETNYRLTKNLKTGIRKQNLMYNYYLCKYNPGEVAAYCRDIQPVILFNTEPHDIVYYLEANKIKPYMTDDLDSLKQTNQNLYLITVFPYTAKDSLKNILPGFYLVEEELDPGYYGVIKCQKK